jgi:hypothetical protein
MNDTERLFFATVLEDVSNGQTSRRVDGIRMRSDSAVLRDSSIRVAYCEIV